MGEMSRWRHIKRGLISKNYGIEVNHKHKTGVLKFELRLELLHCW